MSDALLECNSRLQESRAYTRRLQREKLDLFCALSLTLAALNHDMPDRAKQEAEKGIRPFLTMARPVPTNPATRLATGVL